MILSNFQAAVVGASAAHAVAEAWRDPVFVGSVSTVSVLLLGALVIVFMLTRAARRNESNLVHAREATEALPVPATHDSLSRIAEALSFDPVLDAQWKEFREGVVDVERGGVQTVRNTLAFDAFLKDDAYLHSIRWWKVRFPLLHRIPGFCTGVGILGTFAGITVALTKLTEALASAGGGDGDALGQTALIASLPALVSSLSSAFVTSILGVLASLGITLYVSARESHILGELDSLRQAIDRHVVRITPEELLELQRQVLEDIHRESSESRGNLQTIADDLADKIGDRMQGSLTEVLLPQLQAMTRAVREQVRTAGTSSTEQARRFTDEMVQQLTGSLQSSFSQMGSAVAASTQQLTAVSEQLHGVVEKAQDATTQQGQLMQASSAAVRQAQEGARKSAEDMQAIQQVAQQLGSLSEGLSGHLATTAQLQQQQAQERVAAEQNSKQASAQQAQAASRLLEAAQSLATLLDPLPESVAALSRSTESAAGQVERASTALVQRTQHEEQLFSTLREATQTMAHTMESSKPALAAFDKAAERLSEQPEKLDEIAKRFDALLQRMNGAARDVQDELEKISHVMRDTASGMTSVLKNVDDWSTRTNQALERYGSTVNGTLQQTLNDYDKALGGAVSNLQGALTEFADVAEEMAGASRRVQARRQ